MARPKKDLADITFNGWDQQLSNIMCCCDGTIKNTKTGNTLKPYRMKKGHLQVSVSRSGKVKKCLAHRIVAQYFCNNESNKPCVNHIDGNPANNNYANLEWCTDIENKSHAKRNKMFQQSTNRYNSVFDEIKILTIHTLNWTHTKIAKHYNVSQSVITRIKSFDTYSNFAVIYGK